MPTRPTGGPNIVLAGPPPANDAVSPTPPTPKPPPKTNVEAFADENPGKQPTDVDPTLMLEVDLPQTVKRQLIETLLTKVKAFGGLLVRFGEKHYVVGQQKSAEFVKWLAERNLLLSFTGVTRVDEPELKVKPVLSQTSAKVSKASPPFVRPAPVTNDDPVSPHGNT